MRKDVSRWDGMNENVQSKATKALLKVMVSFLCFVWFCWEYLIFYFERTCVGELLIVRKCPLVNELVIDVAFLSFTKGWLGLKIVNDGFGLDWCSKSFDWGANSPCCRLHRVQFSKFPLCHWCEIVNARCTHKFSVYTTGKTNMEIAKMMMLKMTSFFKVGWCSSSMLVFKGVIR